MRLAVIRRGSRAIAMIVGALLAMSASATASNHARSFMCATPATCRALALTAERALIPSVQLVTPQGEPLGGALQQWADQSKVPTGNYRLIIDPSLPCGPGAVPVGPPTTAAACSEGPVPNSTPGTPFETYVSTSAFQVRDDLYFELGHQFDWHFLTTTDRRYLARKWGLAHWHWWDTAAGLAAGSEDGLEGIFAAIYQDCADGINDQGGGLTLWEPGSPEASPTINTCAYIDRVAARSEEPPDSAACSRSPGLLYRRRCGTPS